MKKLREYYFRVIHNHLPHDLKHTCGVILLNLFFSSVHHLAVIATTHDKGVKISAIKDFLLDYAVITDEIEFLVDARAVSFHQAEVMYKDIIDIEEQMGAFRKSLKNGCATPQSTE